MKTRLTLILLFLILVIASYSQHSRNLIIYNTTSTDCGPCSCLDSIFDKIVPLHYPSTIIVEFHAIGSNPNLRSFQGDSIVETFIHDLSLEPSTFINGFGYDVNYRAIIDTLQGLYNEFPYTPIDLKIKSKSWNPETQTISFNIHFKNDGLTLNGDYWYNVILTEDNIITIHHTKDSCSTPNLPAGYDSSYINNNVTRKMVYWSNGTSLTESIWESNQEFVKPCSFVIDPDSSWIPENCSFVVDVYLKEDSIYQSPVLQAIKEPIISPSVISETNRHNIGLKIFPNPTNTHCNVHLSLTSGLNCNLKMYNTNGQVVKNVYNAYLKQGMYNIELNLGEFESGIYFFILETEGDIYSRKLVIE